MTSLSKTITIIGITLIIYYSLTKILLFWGIGFDIYGLYVYFYFMIIILILLLPTNEI
jgi:hypothetical protein